MYIPAHFDEPDRAVLHALMRAHPFGAWVTPAAGTLLVNHLPFLLDPSRGPNGTLAGHVSRANPAWRDGSVEAESVVIFQGAQTYVTPSWYESKRETGKTVPTWNYAVVHARGVPRIIHDADWLLRHVTALTDAHEAGERVPWRVTDAPPDYVQAMLRGIVGIEIEVTALVGKWKASQNRSLSDRLGVVSGLEARGDDGSREMAALVRERAVRSGT